MTLNLRRQWRCCASACGRPHRRQSGNRKGDVMARGTSACVMLVGALLGTLAVSRAPVEQASATDDQAAPRPGLRRPVALALADGGQWLFVANQGSGSIAVIETGSRRVVAEVPVGRKLSDLAITPDGRHLLVTDEEAGELVV